MKVRGTNRCCCVKNSYSNGYYTRSSDGQRVNRYRCKTCNKTFSSATLSPLKWQKKRQVNYPLMKLLSHNVSLSGAAKILNINPKTVARKLAFLGETCRHKLAEQAKDYTQISAIEFDELQTIEHTKCKPLSIAVAVAKKERKILGFRVSKMPATGHLAAISRKKYGKRADERAPQMKALFNELTGFLNSNIAISSDKCPFYSDIVTQYFPDATYKQYLGKKGSVAGQGELKKTIFDPIFTINHTFAMMRACISRLIRRTWNTTKKIQPLIDHLNIYIWMHNNQKTPLFVG